MHQNDWVFLLNDVLNGSIAAIEIFCPNRGDLLESAAKVTIAKLSFTSQQIIASALFDVIRVSNSKSKNDPLGDTINFTIKAIRFSTVLPAEKSVRSLQGILATTGINENVRWEALRALGHFSGNVDVGFWTRISLEKWPNAAGVVLNALSHCSPLLALQKLNELTVPLHESISIEYPLRNCLRRIAGSPHLQVEFLRIYNHLPEWALKPLNDLLNAPEFYDLATSREKIVPFHALSGWAAWCRQLSVLRYVYFGYFALGEQKPSEIPTCFRDYLQEFRVEIASGEGRPDQLIRARRIKGITNNAAVDEVFAWQTILIEPGYLTAGRAKDKDVFTIGTVCLQSLREPRP